MNNINVEKEITIQELISLTEFYRREAERKRELLQRSAQLIGRKLDVAEIERAGHEDDKLAEAHSMLLRAISERAIKNRSGNTVQTQILFPEAEGGKPVTMQVVHKKSPVVPEIKDESARQQAQDMLDNAEIEESIYEAARLADGRTNNQHWEIARSKSVHFYRGSDRLSTNPTNREVDNFIREVVRNVKSRLEAKFIEENLISRAVSPASGLADVQRMQYVQNGRFNVAILTGDAKVPVEDRMKLTAIHEFTKGNENKAVSIIRNAYKEKNWDEITAREFLYLLMKKNPHKELETVIENILWDNATKKGDAKKGIKLCRNIIGLYFGKKYTIQIGTTPLTADHERDNQLIDRIINRNLVKVADRTKKKK